MAGMPGLSNEQIKQQQQFLNMRGSQIAMENAGQEQTLEGITAKSNRAVGSRKQLIGTVIGVIAALAILILLAKLHII